MKKPWSDPGRAPRSLQVDGFEVVGQQGKRFLMLWVCEYGLTLPAPPVWVNRRERGGVTVFTPVLWGRGVLIYGAFWPWREGSL